MYIKPCPFCGDKVEMVNKRQYAHWVECMRCGIGTLDYHTEEEAAKIWNELAETVRTHILISGGYISPGSISELKKLLKVDRSSKDMERLIRNCERGKEGK